MNLTTEILIPLNDTEELTNVTQVSQNDSNMPMLTIFGHFHPNIPVWGKWNVGI